MESTVWNFVVPIPPVELGNITYTIMKYLEARENKFVPELNALLLQYKKKTLRILGTSTLASHDYSTPFSHMNSTCLVPVHPELFGSLNLRAQISVRVFSPRLGTELTVTVSAVKPHLVFCVIEGAPNVSITLTRCSETGLVKLASPSDESVTLSVGDVINVRLSALSQNPDLFLLRAEPIRINNRIAPALVSNTCPKSLGVFSSDEEVTVTKEVSSKKKKKKRQSITEPLVKQDEPDQACNSSTSNDGVTVTYNKEHGSLMLTRKRCNSEDSPDDEASMITKTKPEPGMQQPSSKRKRCALEEAHVGGANYSNGASCESESQGEQSESMPLIKSEEGVPLRKSSLKGKSRNLKEQTQVSTGEETENLISSPIKQKTKKVRTTKLEQTS